MEPPKIYYANILFLTEFLLILTFNYNNEIFNIFLFLFSILTLFFTFYIFNQSYHKTLDESDQCVLVICHFLFLVQLFRFIYEFMFKMNMIVYAIINFLYCVILFFQLDEIHRILPRNIKS